MQRIKSLESARGFTVLMIAPIHTVMLYSKLEIRNTLLVNFLAFIAEWHGAQIFMLLMGISFTFSKKNDFETILQRASALLGAAYALNIFKFVIPHLFGLLPQSLLNELQIENGWYGFIQLFLIGDILHFASFALIILFIIHKQKNYQWATLAIALTICLASPFIWDMHSHYYLVDYFLQLIGGQPPHIYFPFFPWLVYPLIGLAIGYWLQKTKHQKIFWLLRDIGWMLILFSLILKYFISDKDFSLFYRTKPLDTILHVGVVFVALSIWDWISDNIKPNHVFRFLTYLSENITLVYITQWVIICWLLPVFGYQTLGFIPTLFCIALTSFMTLGISLSISAYYGNKKVYDILGIGIGPFNLGLAALASEIENLKCIFFDQQKEFNWHPGLLLNNARLQVPFLADLVTLANPRSQFSYLNFIHAKQRMIRFGIHENYFISRKEYNQYCKWVIAQLDNLHFGHRCEAIHFDNDKKLYRVFIKEIATDKIKCFYTRHIVIGIGTIPNIPTFIKNFKHSHLLHSADYLFHKEQILNRKSVAIIGSGQSAAEIFYDLLQHEQNFESLNWFTRSERFYPMDYSKFALEMTSPDYIDHFFGLSPLKKKEVLQKQNTLYKGINFSLISEISDALHDLNMDTRKENIHLMANAELKNIITDQLGVFNLAFYHKEKQQDFDYPTEAIILATGYKYVVPDFLQSIKELVQWNDEGFYNVNRNYSIDKNDSVFVQNADLHSHGFNSADLGLGPYRNAVILNSVLKEEHFPLEKNIAFQTFGIPI